MTQLELALDPRRILRRDTKPSNQRQRPELVPVAEVRAWVERMAQAA